MYERLDEPMIAAAILICEVAFWVLAAGGLAARCALGRARLGAVLLACVPLVDVILLVATAADLASGARADWTHGLAALYIGFGVVFGPSFVRAADRRFERRFPARATVAPSRAPEIDPLAAQWRLWRCCLLASGFACAAIGALIFVAGDPDRTRALWQDGGWFAQLDVLCVVWLLLGPAWTATSRRMHGRAARSAQTGRA